MPFQALDFQSTVIDGLLARLRQQAALYRQLSNNPHGEAQARRHDAGLVLVAPTGAGKTGMAIETLAKFAADERVLWFWFAPFNGLVEQAASALRAQAPQLTLLDLASDRRLAAVQNGGVFVTTWSALAASNAEARKARVRSDAGLAIDELLVLARQQGLRIGVVVDEAHHGFHKAKQAQALFRDVLKPDYALMMTATPRDGDVAGFERDTGYRLGRPEDWASVARVDAVAKGLLKPGVRVVRFLARDGDEKQLIDFERLALRECTQTHRAIKAQLVERGIGLTPLMLVQVPDGKVAQEAARRFLVDSLGFAESAVRLHTSDEPDPDLLALAQDPSVEVLIFKMAVAIGFDAPRAFTLAALRGARDASFGVQVVGRIVRVHPLLRHRSDLSAALQQGYVFLANAESQEGLLAAGAQINALRTQAPELGSTVTLTVSGGQQEVQVVDAGRSFALPFAPAGNGASDGSASLTALDASGERIEAPAPWTTAAQSALGLIGGDGVAAPRPPSSSAPTGAVTPLAMQVAQGTLRYPRRAGVPERIASERLPAAPQDFETRLADFVDFSQEVLGARMKSRAKVLRSESEVFGSEAITEGEQDIWATLSPEAVASKADQIAMRLNDANQRLIRQRLLERFRTAIEQSGAVPPDDEEELEQQLDLVLVRHPTLLSKAYKAARLHALQRPEAVLREVIESDIPLAPAARNAYGVFENDMNPDELAIAKLLDAHPQVRWWHRNRSDARSADAVGLYAWDEGDGFYPDFVVSIAERPTPDGIALLEVKGSHLWGQPKEVEKGSAVHPDHQRVYMVGRRKGEQEYRFLLPLKDRLEPEGVFEIGRLRWV
jgi:superfamily II DNA or RNA helicase